MDKAIIKQPYYAMGVDTYDKNALAYCLSRKVDGVVEPKCDHKVWEPNRFPGGRSIERGHARVLCRGTVEIGRWNIPIKTQQDAMGIQWITELRKLSESIPPAFTRYIGEQWLSLHCH